MPVSRRIRRVAGALLLATVVVGWVLGARVVSDGRLQKAPLLLVGPEVVTAALIDQLHADGDASVVVGGTQSPHDARDALEAGDVVGVVEIDLRGATDTLRLPQDRSPARDAAVTEAVRTVEDSHDRALSVDKGAGAPSGLAYATLAALLGYGFVLVLSLLRGPVAPTLRRALARQGGLLGAALVGGAVATATWSVGVGLMVTLIAFSVGLTTLAFEALGGLRGLVGSAVLTLLLPLPLIGAGDRLLLAQPWQWVTDWTIVGAGTRGIATAGAYDLTLGGLAQPVLVLAGTVALSVAVLATTRWVYLRPGSDRAAPSAVDGSAPGSASGPVVPRSWQLQTGALVATVIVSVAVVVTFISPVPAGPREPVASLASISDCVGDGGAVSDVDDLNRIAEIRSADALQGGDVGASAGLQDGRSVWVFGDTLRTPDSSGPRVVRNSMLVVEPACLRVVRPRAEGAVIPDRGDGVGYWPMSVVVEQKVGYDLVSVTAQRVHTIDADDPFGFEALGPSVATFVAPLGEVPQLISVTDLGPDDTDTTSPMWGAATAAAGEWVYLYGTSRPAVAEPGTGFALRVARAPAGALTEQSQWAYWNGSDWGSDPAGAAELIGAQEGTSQTLSVFAQGDSWFVLSKQGEVLGDDIVVWTGSAPQGPFGDPTPVAPLPSDAAAGELRYMPLAHPRLLPADGTVVVSYSQNSTDLGAVLDDPLLYRPRFLRVTLPNS